MALKTIRVRIKSVEHALGDAIDTMRAIQAKKKTPKRPSVTSNKSHEANFQFQFLFIIAHAKCWNCCAAAGRCYCTGSVY